MDNNTPGASFTALLNLLWTDPPPSQSNEAINTAEVF